MSIQTDQESTTTTLSTERVCYNPLCKKPLVRYSGESAHHFRARKHCDHSNCALTNPILRKAQSEEYARKREAQTKKCTRNGCSKTFTRNRYQNSKSFERQRFCSPECFKADQHDKSLEQIRKDVKICKNPECKRTFHRRISPNSIESKERWRKRETCSVPCGAAVRWKPHQLQRWRSGGGRPSSSMAKHKLPEVSPVPITIPPAPERPPTPIWRPAAIGRDVRPKVS